jgi:lipopolysaccharide biosynthesis regulator YciM
VIRSLCRIYEDIGDWDQAYNYRIMLSKVGQDNQSETISHILVEKAKYHFNSGDYRACAEDLDDAFRFAPSVSAKILRLKLYLIQNKIEDANALLNELLKEHPMYTSFIFVSLDDTKNVKEKDNYLERLQKLKSHFLEINDDDLKDSPSVVLSQIRLLKSEGRSREAFELLNDWLKEFDNNSDVLKIEFIKLLIETGNHEKALEETQILLSNLHSSLTRHFCSQCGFNSDEIFWRCPQCHKWETIQFRWKV